MQDLSFSFIVKLGAIPPPILATIALMAESHNVESTEMGEQSASNCVDIEHMVREHPYYRHRKEVTSPGELDPLTKESSTKEQNVSRRLQTAGTRWMLRA
jgi:hypothetical protein